MYSVNETVEANDGDPEVSWARPWPLFVPKLSTLSRSRRPQPSRFISAHPSPIVQTADLHQVTEAVLSTLSDSCMAHLRHDEVRMARPQCFQRASSPSRDAHSAPLPGFDLSHAPQAAGKSSCMEMDKLNEPDIDLNHQLLTIIKNHDVFTEAAIGNAMILLLEQMSESIERDEDDDDMPSNIRTLNTDGFLVRIPVPLPTPSYAQSLSRAPTLYQYGLLACSLRLPTLCAPS